MISPLYEQSVQRGIDFQNSTKIWNGHATVDYALEIKKYIDKYKSQSLLDYGCGKALHYVDLAVYSSTSTTFDKFINVSKIFKYDPCIKEFDTLPNKDMKFDATIAIQCLPYVPDDDIPWVIELLMHHTKDFCFVGNQHPDKPMKKKKLDLLDKDAFRVTRDINWWETQFKHWRGSELILHWI
jgi:hypothetical protein